MAARRPGRSRQRKKADTTAKSARRARPRSARAEAEAPVEPESSRARASDLIIVGVGASAGGLEALEGLFRHVPSSELAMAFVVVTHLHPERVSRLPELIQAHTTLRVAVTSDGALVESGSIYFSPPGHIVTIQNRRLHLEEVSRRELRTAVDAFFRSLARDQSENAVAIVLSGTGSDGSGGIAEIKAASGMVMAQEPSTAAYPGMPESAIATGCVDYVLPVHELAEQLERYARAQFRLRASSGQTADEVADSMQKIFQLLNMRTGHDFSAYKKSTIHRRIERRMAVQDCGELSQYLETLQNKPDETDALFRDLLISVTSFFRDPDAFAALERALEQQLRAKRQASPFRAWVPGCAIGQEAYSVAIAVREAMLRAGRQFPVQIFATDLDPQAIEAARRGQYPLSIADDIPPERLERHFRREDAHYVIHKDIRDLLIFAPQNLTKDPPFTRLDLLTCRNVLIYLEPQLQQTVLGMFTYALRAGGLLLLGNSESLGSFGNAFVPVDKKWKLFERKDDGTLEIALAEVPLEPLPRRADVAPSTGKARLSRRGIAEALLLASFAPPSVLIDHDGNVLFVHGRTGEFLEPPTGEPTSNLFAMAREGLRLQLTALVREAVRLRQTVVRRKLQLRTNGKTRAVTLCARPTELPELADQLLLVSFIAEEPVPVPKGRRATGEPLSGAAGRVRELEAELQQTRETLQGTIEELETSNEELKSTNEELQSTNEELQSANEELETSREEMQSLNEELQTVNSELEERNQALTRANDDMQNLLNSTNVATVFLDGRLAIKRFTTAARTVFNLIDRDVGRPLSDLAANLRYDRLMDDAREVLSTLVFTEREVQTTEGAWRLMRIMPYRTADNVIDGLVLTFIDIDTIKLAQQAVERARSYAEAILDDVPGALLVLDGDLRVVALNRAFQQLFDVRGAPPAGKRLAALGAPWRSAAFETWLRRHLAEEAASAKHVLEGRFPKLGTQRLRLTVSRARHSTGPERLVVLVEKITGNRE